jgi:hypothetical protein
MATLTLGPALMRPTTTDDYWEYGEIVEVNGRGVVFKDHRTGKKANYDLSNSDVLLINYSPKDRKTLEGIQIHAPGSIKLDHSKKHYSEVVEEVRTEWIPIAPQLN